MKGNDNMARKSQLDSGGKSLEEMASELNAKKELPPDLPKLPDLDHMTKEELIALVRCVGGAIWGYALDDNEQKAEAARLKLYNLGMSATEVHKVVPALDKWFDRTAGKAPQSIAIATTSTVEHLVLLPETKRFMDEILAAHKPKVINN